MAMVSVDPSAFLFALCTSEVQPHHFAFHLYTAQKNSIGENAVASEPRSYFDLLLVAVLWFIQTDHVDQKPNGNYGNRARTDPAKRGSVSEKAGVSRRQQTHRQPQNSRLQVLSTQLLHKLLHQARLPAHTSNQVGA
ncbi:hypothetical protein SARC_14338 [Sphaeroforma arctica JP610]|uniref:Uncharacterized protein n=1 Tax=Sphaeroforma arctica JP610 TaxID=667725 RepID=A0A0L0F8Q7_9EUKA|nr:hypothetical protein SARC_14338 [Sphaeroforma arctica JP610]KNC73104.1 hypothetical protein SARC_14338 [Sphaeroforma arctica JP610]|eukprot:XP_014147006.1 hypothetical protein SARC_14338 [Sphaeroforma arctica JP610]